MEWIQVLTLFLANAGLVLWFRAESRSDWRHMDAKLEASISAIREETRAFQQAIQAEIKDFHGRLCAIEERRAN